MARLVALVAAALLVGCAAPRYQSGHLRCAPSGKRCPDSFYCAADDRCWLDGTAPDLGRGLADMAAGQVIDLAGGDLASSVMPSQCPAGVLLCDGFEASSISGDWRVVGAGASAALDATRAFRGMHSVHVHTDAAAAGSDPNAGIVESKTFPITSTAWVRLWVYFASPYPTAFNQVINFLDNGTHGASYATRNGVAVDNNYGGNAYRESMLAIPVDSWVCLRMSIGQGGTTGDIHIFVGDQEAGDAQLLGTPVTPMASVALGADWVGNPALGATDLWIDEVIVDNKPITCAE